MCLCETDLVLVEKKVVTGLFFSSDSIISIIADLKKQYGDDIYIKISYEAIYRYDDDDINIIALIFRKPNN